MMKTPTRFWKIPAGISLPLGPVAVTVFSVNKSADPHSSSRFNYQLVQLLAFSIWEALLDYNRLKA